MSFKASAPGSVMLMGEHAVLHGYPALVAAIDRFITIEIESREDCELHIYSELGELHTTIDAFHVEPPFQFLLAVLKQYQTRLPTGLNISVESTMSSTVGLGTSAAITVATVKALKELFDHPHPNPPPSRGREKKTPSSWKGESWGDQYTLFQEALEIIQSVQGVGSGADVAASTFGGLLVYTIPEGRSPGGRSKSGVRGSDEGISPCSFALRTSPGYGIETPLNVELALFYSGSKTPTPEVIQQVEKNFANCPEALNAIYQKTGECVEQAIKAIDQKNWDQLGKAFYQQQALMVELGVNNQALQALIDRLEQHQGVKGVKISGSGLGDCVLAIAEPGTFDHCEDNSYIPIKIEG